MSHKILDKLAKELTALQTLVEPLSEAELDQQHGDGWTIREILTHLWNAEEDHCRVISIIARGEGKQLEEMPALDLAAHNASRLEERGTLTKAEMLGGLAAQRARTEGLFHRLSAEQMAMEGRHPALGQMSAEKIFRIIGIHMKMHGQEIAEALQ